MMLHYWWELGDMKNRNDDAMGIKGAGLKNDFLLWIFAAVCGFLMSEKAANRQ